MYVIEGAVRDRCDHWHRSLSWAVLVREAVAEAARPETEPSTFQPFDPSTLQSSRTQVLEQAAAQAVRDQAKYIFSFPKNSMKQ